MVTQAYLVRPSIEGVAQTHPADEHVHERLLLRVPTVGATDGGTSMARWARHTTILPPEVVRSEITLIGIDIIVRKIRLPLG